MMLQHFKFSCAIAVQRYCYDYDDWELQETVFTCALYFCVNSTENNDRQQRLSIAFERVFDT